MATITFTVSDGTCSGSGHYDIDITVPALGTVEWHVHKSELLEAPSNEELKTTARVLTRLVAGQLANTEHGLVRAKMHGLTLDISPLA